MRTISTARARSCVAPVIAALLALAVSSPAAFAQDAPGSSLRPDELRRQLAFRPAFVDDPVRVMILGTVHLANPGQDRVNPTVDDVLAPRRQAELQRLVADLARFRPTHVAVERTRDRDSALQARYAEVRAGAPMSRSETEQVGMRLAARMGHDRVHPVDYQHPLDMQSVFAHAEQHDTAFARRAPQVFAAIARMLQTQLEAGTLPAMMLRSSDPGLADFGHGAYMDMALVGGGDEYVGADMVADWYERNLKIFVNLTRIARPGDRIVLVIGGGHEPLLRHYVEMTPGFEVVPVSHYVQP